MEVAAGANQGDVCQNHGGKRDIVKETGLGVDERGTRGKEESSQEAATGPECASCDRVARNHHQDHEWNHAQVGDLVMKVPGDGVRDGGHYKCKRRIEV